ncbi:hypothetical protein D3C78_1501750 [compost metagenome]
MAAPITAPAPKLPRSLEAPEPPVMMPATMAGILLDSISKARQKTRITLSSSKLGFFALNLP